MKKNDEEEKQFHAAATNIISEEMFPDKSIKQLNAKVSLYLEEWIRMDTYLWVP